MIEIVVKKLIINNEKYVVIQSITGVLRKHELPIAYLVKTYRPKGLTCKPEVIYSHVVGGYPVGIKRYDNDGVDPEIHLMSEYEKMSLREFNHVISIIKNAAAYLKEVNKHLKSELSDWIEDIVETYTI